MPEVHDITSVTKPSKSLWKTGLKTVAVTAVIAIVGSAAYHNLKKDGKDSVETAA